MSDRKYRADFIEREWNKENKNSPIKRSELTRGISHEHLEFLPRLWEKLNKVATDEERLAFWEFFSAFRDIAMLAKVVDGDVTIDLKGRHAVEFMKKMCLIPGIFTKNGELKEVYYFGCSERAVELERISDKLREKERKRLEREKKKAHLKEVQDYTDSLTNPEDR